MQRPLHRLLFPSRIVWYSRLRSLIYMGLLSYLFYAVLPGMILTRTGGWNTPALLGLRNPPLLTAFLVPPLLLGGWAVLKFTDDGEGTPLPLDMPRRLVLTGPYAYIRNPMQITGLALAGLRTLYHPIAAMLLYWVALVLLAVFVFCPYERFQLERAFGESYRHYCRHVRNWLPRLSPYKESREDDREESGQ